MMMKSTTVAVLGNTATDTKPDAERVSRWNGRVSTHVLYIQRKGPNGNNIDRILLASHV